MGRPVTARIDQLVAPRFQSPPPTGYDPRGFAVGVLSMQGLAQQGIALRQWRWRYGPAMRERPFPQHRELEGRFMTLEGTLGQWYPGDHKGCLCAVVPVYGRGGRAISQAEAEAATAPAPTPATFREFDGLDHDGHLSWLRDTAEANGLGAVSDYAATARGYADDVRAAAKEYIGTGYDWLNKALRKDKLYRSEQATVDALDRGIAATTVPENITTFRGVSSSADNIVAAFDDGSLAGTTIRDHGYQSVTLSDKQAATFSGKNGVLLEIRLRSGQNALIGSAEEAEMILPRGTKLRITELGTRTVRYLGKDIEMRRAIAEVVD
jgi:hypothetical protein